ARWEWWGARAQRVVAREDDAGAENGDAPRVLGALLALVDVPAPLGARGPALDAGMRVATDLGDGAAARRFDAARLAAARALRDGTPPDLRASLDGVAWAREALPGAAIGDVTFV